MIADGKGVSQAQSNRGGRKGRPPLSSCMPADSATAHLGNGIASEAHVRNGGAKGPGRRRTGQVLFNTLAACLAPEGKHRLLQRLELTPSLRFQLLLLVAQLLQGL